jgi:hypothetical protein
VVDPAYDFVRQPESTSGRARPGYITYLWTVDALKFYGRACWFITERYADTTRPKPLQWLPEWNHRPTTTGDPAQAVLDGIAAILDLAAMPRERVDFLVLGTTLATNAVLEGKCARTGMITTEGFRDILEIGRHVRRDVYVLKPKRESALISRDRRLALPERIRADGSVERPLEAAAVEAAVAAIRALAAETVAVSLLNANVNAAHERSLRDGILRALPGLPVSISSEVSPEIREYERSSTTVLNAYLRPDPTLKLPELIAKAKGGGGQAGELDSKAGIAGPRGLDPLRGATQAYSCSFRNLSPEGQRAGKVHQCRWRPRRPGADGSVRRREGANQEIRFLPTGHDGSPAERTGVFSLSRTEGGSASELVPSGPAVRPRRGRSRRGRRDRTRA